jgi:hypothetical protein
MSLDELPLERQDRTTAGMARTVASARIAPKGFAARAAKLLIQSASATASGCMVDLELINRARRQRGLDGAEDLM